MSWEAPPPFLRMPKIQLYDVALDERRDATQWDIDELQRRFYAMVDKLHRKEQECLELRALLGELNEDAQDS